mmetsp:Transcript_25007/g.71880  ORF Transcript_25007/g.71880 Transcript_25007/m.71880 type:complete len:250 (+) Transcript_25007:1610-2359(+)
MHWWGVTACGNYCGVRWCGGSPVRERYGPRDHFACNFSVEPAFCADGCCREHDRCCGLANDTSSCDHSMIECQQRCDAEDLLLNRSHQCDMAATAIAAVSSVGLCCGRPCGADMSEWDATVVDTVQGALKGCMAGCAAGGAAAGGIGCAPGCVGGGVVAGVAAWHDWPHAALPHPGWAVLSLPIPFVPYWQRSEPAAAAAAPPPGATLLLLPLAVLAAAVAAALAAKRHRNRRQRRPQPSETVGAVGLL